MKKMNDINRLLKEALDPVHLELDTPDFARIRTARNLIIQRQNSSQQDVFALLASFLNMRIKLYHAVIASLLIWICIMAFQQKEPARQEVNTIVHESNLAAINNSTLLPSIQTCIIRK